MKDRIEQAINRIERDIKNTQSNFKEVLDQRGRLTRNLHALIVEFEEKRAKIDDKIYDVQLQEKHLKEQELELKAQLKALKELNV